MTFSLFQICERLLKAHAGITLADYHAFLSHAAQRQLQASSSLHTAAASVAAHRIHCQRPSGTAGNGIEQPSSEQTEGLDTPYLQPALAACFRLAKLRLALRKLEDLPHLQALARLGVIPGVGTADAEDTAGVVVSTALQSVEAEIFRLLGIPWPGENNVQ